MRTTSSTRFSQYSITAHALTSVILTRKPDSRRHSTTCFCEPLMLYWRRQVIKCQKFYNFAIGRGLQPPFVKNDRVNFSDEKLSKNKPFRGVWFLRICEKTLLQSRLRSTKSSGRNPQIKVLYQKEKVKVSDQSFQTVKTWTSSLNLAISYFDRY